jgi:hypothetical protein
VKTFQPKKVKRGYRKKIDKRKITKQVKKNKKKRGRKHEKHT